MIVIKRFSVKELVIMSLLATVGIVIKPAISGVTHVITSALYIPAGSVSGGLYFMPIIVGVSLIDKKFVGLIICLIQAMIASVTGVYGSHGLMSLITYTIPGIFLDLAYFLLHNIDNSHIVCILSGGICNIIGALIINYIFFMLPIIPLIFSLLLACCSGMVGGFVAGIVTECIKKSRVLHIESK